MAKAIGVILAVVEIGVGIATGNIGLVVAGGLALAGSVSALLFGPQAAKPETTEQSIKTERPPRVRALGRSRLYPASIVFETINGTTVDVGAYHDGRAHAIIATYLNDNLVTAPAGIVTALEDKSYQNGKLKLGYSLGAPIETAFAAVAAIMPEWDASHRGDGVVCGYLLKAPEDAKHFLETYPQGDQVQLSLVGEWTPKYDPRDPAQDPYDEATWGWSDNAALAFIWYMMVERGYDWNTSFAPRLSMIIHAINVADADLTLAAGGTEKRYRTALSYKATEEPANVISSLLACFDGWYIVNEKREILLYAGEYYEPSVSIGPDQIVSWRQPMNVEKENVVNEIAIPYVSSLHDYGTVDGEAWRDEDSISLLGRANTAELGAVVPSHTQGRRLAKIKMARNNAVDRGTLTTTFAGRVIFGQRFINLRTEEAGAVWFDGVAEIIAAERDTATGGTTIEWVAADESAWTWNAATEDGEGAPVEARYAPAPLTVPTITAATSVYAEATDAGTGTRIQIIATGPADEGLTWYVRHRSNTGAPWNEQEFPDIDPGPSVTLLTGFVPVVAGLEVEVEYRNGSGQLSGWSAPFTVDARTDVTAPDAATAPTLVSWTDAIRLTANRIPRAASYRWRFYQISDPGDATFDLTSAALPTGATLTRASTAYRTTPIGSLSSSAVDAARFDYDPITHALTGLLYERTATNMALRSEEFDNASWVKLNSTVTANAAAAPDGNTTADKLAETTATAQHRCSQVITTVIGTTYACTVYVKAVERSKVQLRMVGATTFAFATFDLVAGSVTGVNGTVAITQQANGWWRISIAGVSDATSTTAFINLADASGTTSYTGTTGSGVLLWGAQFETIGKTSYISTTTASATRAADVLTLDWKSLAVPNGATTLLVTFDDASTQTRSTTITAGKAVLTTDLNRPRVRSVMRQGSEALSLVRTITTGTGEVVYTSSQAASDGPARSYKIDVAGVNAAGVGTVSMFLPVAKAAPAAVGSPAVASGDTTAVASSTVVAGAAGYVVFFGDTSGFDPAMAGGVVSSPTRFNSIYGLAAGTYYGRIAAFDQWSANPDILNLSSAISFTIALGGGSTPSGGGSDGGGYHGGGGPGSGPLP